MTNISIIILICFSLTPLFAQNKIPTKVTGGVCNKQAVYFPQPDYPKSANVTGIVNVQVRIDEKGNVETVTSIFGHPLLRPNAEKAARKAKFKPTILSGKPVKESCVLTYQFNPSEKELEKKKGEIAKPVSVGILNKKSVSMPVWKEGFDHLRITKDQIVAVQVLIDKSGKVIKADALAGHPLLRLASETAARRATFSPILIDNFPMNVQGLLVYKYKPNREVETDIASDDKDVVGLPVDLTKPSSPFCNCNFGSNPSVIVVANVDEQGNVNKAQAVSGHPLLRIPSEKAAIKSKFLPTNVKTVVFIVYKFKAIDKHSVEISEIEVKKPIINK